MGSVGKAGDGGGGAKASKEDGKSGAAEEGQTAAKEAESKEELEVVELDRDALEVESGGPAVFSFLRSVTKLNLCRNLVKEIQGLGSLKTLVSLELYDNQISSMAGLEGLERLEVLDLSYNRLAHICHLESLRSLRKLYLVHNKIRRIQGLGNLGRLELLELGDNKIRKVEGLEELRSLEQLFLGKNKIRRLEGLGSLGHLRQLSIQANRLTVLEGLEGVGGSLRELLVSENGLSQLGPGLRSLQKLQLLDLAINFISRLPKEDLSHLRHLKDFWFNDNRLEDWAELESIRRLPDLRVLYLHGNPLGKLCPKDPDSPPSPDYRRKLLFLFPVSPASTPSTPDPAPKPSPLPTASSFLSDSSTLHCTSRLPLNPARPRLGPPPLPPAHWITFGADSSPLCSRPSKRMAWRKWALRERRLGRPRWMTDDCTHDCGPSSCCSWRCGTSGSGRLGVGLGGG